MTSKKLKLKTTQNINYGQAQYWQQRYKKTEGQRFDWLQGYQSLKDLIFQLVNQNKNAKILNIGCGNSQIQDHMYQDGYHNIVNNDISKIVIDQMQQQKILKKQQKMIYQVMDVRSMSYQNKSFDMVLDKSTIDAILCSDSPLVNVTLMLKQIYRILKDDGVYLIISYARPQNRVLHLERKHVNFNIQLKQIQKICQQNGGKFAHYVYICKKRKMDKQMSEKQFNSFIQELKNIQKQEYLS